jgi:hypothetical protein
MGGPGQVGLDGRDLGVAGGRHCPVVGEGGLQLGVVEVLGAQPALVFAGPAGTGAVQPRQPPAVAPVGLDLVAGCSRADERQHRCRVAGDLFHRRRGAIRRSVATEMVSRYTSSTRWIGSLCVILAMTAGPSDSG